MPGPKPAYQPQFTTEELAQARQVAHQYSAPFCQVVRARHTLLLAECPETSNAEAARRLGLDEDTIYKWRRRWAEQPTPGAGEARITPLGSRLASPAESLLAATLC